MTATISNQLRKLRERLNVMRVTLRLDVRGKNFPVVGEAVAPGAPSIRHDESVDQRGAATAQWIMKNRSVLVQSNFSSSDIRPPAALIAAYAVMAQMLAPVVHHDRVVGWISVHSAVERDWKANEIALAADLAAEFSRQLETLAETIYSDLGWTVIYET
jgi:maleate isomerase